MTALYGRALARDFLDVDAILASGRYTRERLLELAAAADAGFDPQMFASALGALSQITDEAFAEYGATAEDIGTLRHRFAASTEQPAHPIGQLALVPVVPAPDPGRARQGSSEVRHRRLRHGLRAFPRPIFQHPPS